MKRHGMEALQRGDTCGSVLLHNSLAPKGNAQPQQDYLR